MFAAPVLLVLLACCNVYTVYGAAVAEDAIKYPGPMTEVDLTKYENLDGPDIPEKCRGKTYCTVKPPDYPSKQFNEMFKGHKKSPLYFNPEPVVEVSLNNRQGDPDANDNCESVISYEPLYKVREKRGDWRTVVQAPDHDFVQKVRLETCTERGAACFTVFPQSPAYTTFCKQKYNSWEVLVSDGKNGTEVIKADLPICCSCHYKSVSLASRFGKPKTR